MKTIFLFLLFCVTASVAQQSFSIEWENITNNLEGTLTTCMIEGNNGAIIIGTPFGCYRSTDKGITWGKINKGLTDKDVRVLTRSATGVLFAGTVRGVFRSLDNGDTWTDVTGNIPPFDAQFFYSHPLGTVYVGVTGHIYYTNDSGATWTEFAKEITNVDRTQYIASVAYGKNNRIFVCFPPYVFKLDPGKNWVKIDENSTGVLYADSTGLMINVRRGFLRMSNTNGDFIYSKSISSYNQYSGLDRIQLLIEIGQTLYPKYYLNNAVIIGGVVIMPKQNVWMNILYSGIDSTCTSCIGGNLQPGRNLPNKLITTMLKHSDGSIYVGTYGSIYKTTDTGNSWTKSSKGLKDPTVFTMFHDNIHSLLFLCTGDGVSKSTDNGLTWVESNTGLKNLLIYSFDVSTKGEIFASSIDGVYTSNDSGKSWFMKNDTFLKDLTIGVVKCLPDGKLFAGSTEESLFMSPDFGKSWGYLGDKIGNIVTCDLLYDRLNNYLYTAFESNIFVSTDKGISFSDGRYGFTRKLRMPQFCRDSENVVYLVEDNLYVQKNLTSNWEMQIFNYTDIGHSYDHWTSCANYTGDVFWGGEGMVKMYDKFANDWFKPSKSLPKSVSPMVTLDTSGYLYTGTIGYGIWRSKKTTTYMVSAQQTKPTDNTIDIPKSSVKLEWKHAPRYKNYEIQISEKNDFSDSTPLQSTKLVSYQPTNLKPNTTYYWKLRTRWGKVASDWSPVWSFTTAMQLPSRIQLISPTNNSATDTVVTLKWSKDDNAERYSCIVKETSTGTVVYEDTTLTTLEAIGIKTKPSTEYQWQVRAYNKIGYGEWSDVWKFTTSYSTSVVDELNNDGITISPLPVMNELVVQGLPDTSYLLEVYDAQGKRVYTSTTSSINTRNLANGSYTLGITFKNHTVYKHFVIITR